MNTLALKTELTHLTMNRQAFGTTPEEVLNRLRRSIKANAMPLGPFLRMRCTNKRKIGRDIQTAQYVLLYDKQSLLIKLTYFLPRNRWEISACSFI
ncbi:MAG: hypothetical protein RIC19_25305 [Phaeodactylibacter sp.]|uniref:hypothetical protein n=1 Tax=Phaeodactylibacter sp. TaxID=1940289 RepID=UPI0032EDEF61